MDNILCDELLQEIFQRLPPSSVHSVSLVCKRWLILYRSSRTSLSLRVTRHTFALIPSLTSFLSQHPSLSSLSLLPSSSSDPSSPAGAVPAAPLSARLLSAVTSSRRNSSKLLSLRFLAGPVPLSSLASLSKSCARLTSLCVNLPRPIFLGWVPSFPCLKELSIGLSSSDDDDDDDDNNNNNNSSLGIVNNRYEVWESEDLDAELGLESLCLAGIRGDDWGLGWLWRSCRSLKRLRLRSCQGIGASYSSFARCLQGLEQVELRTCRSVVDGVLLKLAENCLCLSSLLVYDGGSREGLLRFFSHCRSNLQRLDLRLPLDLNNGHLSAAAANFRGLSSLRLQSCCLVTGEGLKALGIAASNGLEELALINCDVVEREPGLLANLGQHLRQLRKLDLSHNELLLDKELVSMLVSCVRLIELRLRGCKGLTGAAVVSMLRSCKRLENVDVTHCFGMEPEAVELLVKNAPCLRRVEVEGNRLSDAAKMWASSKFVEVFA